MACALNGGILPPVWVYWELKKDEAKPDFVKHTRGYLLHNTEPVKAMTEEVNAIEYLIQKDIPERVWRDYEKSCDQDLSYVERAIATTSYMAKCLENNYMP